MQRNVESNHWDKRWRSEVHLETGKVLIEHSDWRVAHWDEHKRARERVLAQAQTCAKELKSDFGIETERILLFEETRNVVRVVETRWSADLHSEHLLVNQKTST